ncbi:MAG TPA: hypothetical protein VGE52_14955, partial [Pirellulales bacterium]
MPFSSDPDLPSWRLPTLIACVVALAFASGLGGAFVLDDESNITRNVKIHDLTRLDEIAFNPRRVVAYFSFAINWAISGDRPALYHVVNILIHVAATLLLYDLTRAVLRSPCLASRKGDDADFLAAAVALLWGVHPLQTQSVTYIVQRTESLMGLFFFATIWFAARGAWGAPSRARWSYAAAAIACWLGMFTKEVMIVAPLTLLLFDRVFLATSWRELIAQRWGLYLACFAAAACLVLNSGDTLDGRTVAMGYGNKYISTREFAQTQPEVILHYLKLAVWPRDLCLDYGWPVETDPTIIVASSLAIGSLLVATLLALRRDPPWGFVGAWFFLTLAPSSSVIPILDLAFEHRMYLPLVSVVIVVVLSTRWALDAAMRAAPTLAFARPWIALLLLIGATTALAARTWQRNFDYASNETMWRDVIRQRPENARAHLSLAVQLDATGRGEEALAEYREAEQLAKQTRSPDLPLYRYSLALKLKNTGRSIEAIEAFTELIATAPDYGEPFAVRGRLLAQVNRRAEAIADLEEACRRVPADVRSRATLADLLVSVGEYDQAVREAEAGLKADPRNGPLAIARARALLGLRDYAA